ncbi:MAG: hypothetical protein Q9169_007979, partial [Polycauliona sp. 2 TL-2023]
MPPYNPPPIHTPASNQNTIDTDILTTIVPRKGHLVSLRTKAEVEHSELVIGEGYMVAIPQRKANEVLKAIDTLIRTTTTTQQQQQRENDDKSPISTSPPPPSTTSLPHLRRLIPLSALPYHLHTSTIASPSLTNPTNPILHLLTPCLPFHLVHETLSTLLLFEPQISKIPVPLHPPTSSMQAAEWSKRYWPCVYRAYNPWGPQPAEVARGQEELRDVGGLMALAGGLGKEGKQGGRGIGVGCVVVDEEGKMVVGAGDARWSRWGVMGKGESDRDGDGDVRGHAVMRAIEMVARRRREVLVVQHQDTPDSPIPSLSTSIEAHPSRAQQHPPSHQPTSDPSPSSSSSSPSRNPYLTPLESHLYASCPLPANGYLCLNLSIYITHEPCVMCSMAILHSRFSRIVFGKRMSRTGGMSAEVDDFVRERDRGVEREGKQGLEGEGEVEVEGDKEGGEEGEGEVDDDGGREKEGKGEGVGNEVPVDEKVIADGKGETGGNSYGLFHRPDLNWRMLGWQWIDDDPPHPPHV